MSTLEENVKGLENTMGSALSAARGLASAFCGLYEESIRKNEELIALFSERLGEKVTAHPHEWYRAEIEAAKARIEGYRQSIKSLSER